MPAEEKGNCGDSGITGVFFFYYDHQNIMSTETLQDAVISKYENLAKYTLEVQPKFEADIIHKLRIAYKKLRALLRWQKADKRIFNPYKKIYSLAGSLRNIQVVNKMLVPEKDIPAPFTTWLATEFSRLKNEWNQLDYEKPLKQLKNKFKKIELSPKHGKPYFDKKAEKMKMGLDASTISDFAIHNIRKQTKDIQYSVKYWNSNKKKNFLIKYYSVKTLKSITSQIGKYNDYRMGIQFLESFAKATNDQTLIERISAVLIKLQHRKRSRKLRLLNRLNALTRQG